MEHLSFNPSQERLDEEMIRLLLSDTYSSAWSDERDYLQPITWPVQPWLEFDHNGHYHTDALKPRPWIPTLPPLAFMFSRVPVVSFLDYPRARGWTIPRYLVRQNLHRLHPSLRHERVSQKQVEECWIAMIQSWLKVGRLETLFQKSIDSDFLTRIDGYGRRVIDTRNLTFASYARVMDENVMSAVERNATRIRHAQLATEGGQAYQKLYDFLAFNINRNRCTARSFC